MTGQTPLFDDMDLFGYEQADITEAITETEAEQRAEIERDAEGIRTMITATLPAGAADRWAATLGGAVEPVADDQDEEPGPWGVFEEGLCIAAVDSRAVADQLAAEAIAADDGDSEVVVLPLCVEHRDEEQPRGTCEECAADGEDQDDEDREIPSLQELFGKNRPEGATVHAYDVPCGETGGVHHDWNDSEVNCEECLRIIRPERYEEDSADVDQDDAEVDLDALQMTPMVRRMVVDLDSRSWHYQTRKGALDKGLVTDIKATALTEFGEQVRAALLAE
ncbi:hypothetical protein [Nocardiopsis synnemataformans]|uniref:hypothetical protein n=1 Tax=Nocardiopsis synnemataformans TaxID=61305 RepID=UPI003EB6E489